MAEKFPVTIYHNPRCSKSRQTLKILSERPDCEVEVVEYLKKPPSTKELKRILKMLELTPRGLIRTSEGVYKSEILTASNLTDEDLIEKMTEHPILIQRPIVICANQAVIGRPPEKVLDIL